MSDTHNEHVIHARTYSPGQCFNISSQYQYESKTNNTIITILTSQYFLNTKYIDYQLFSRASAVTFICSTTMVGLKWGRLIEEVQYMARFPIGPGTWF